MLFGGCCDAVMHGIVVELLVCDLQRIIRNMFQDISLQLGIFLQHLLRLALGVADVLQVG